MKKNMGTADRLVRILLAAAFAILYFGGYVTGTLGLVLVILGGVFLLTSLVSFCPLYALIGLSTCPKEPKKMQDIKETFSLLLPAGNHDGRK